MEPVENADDWLGRNLAMAQGHVVNARATYAVLERNYIEMSEAVDGNVQRVPDIPARRMR
jgi:hypothetical protein